MQGCRGRRKIMENVKSVSRKMTAWRLSRSFLICPLHLRHCWLAQQHTLPLAALYFIIFFRRILSATRDQICHFATFGYGHAQRKIGARFARPLLKKVNIFSLVFLQNLFTCEIKWRNGSSVHRWPHDTGSKAR